MKAPPFFNMPWDMYVFLTITTVGFGVALNKFQHPEPAVMGSTFFYEDVAQAKAPMRTMLDFGCLDEKMSTVSNLRINRKGLAKTKENHKQFNVFNASVRIKGKLCNSTSGSNGTWTTLTVKNLTNGYEGTVYYHTKENAFVSDQITLADGRNEVMVQWQGNKSDTPQTFVAHVYER